MYVYHNSIELCGLLVCVCSIYWSYLE